ncbi:MAG TPA: L-glutamate gamma-semialdehyde dehydrogenase [Nitriliruptorales bacterium]|nr:L-glutamate gamma-semialdehyde dehydrogenase [Nitriliruptorales bacterium]
MVEARVVPPPPVNEPVRSYAPGSVEKATLKERLDALRKETIEAPCVIAGREQRTGSTFELYAPHDRGLHLATVHGAGAEQVTTAIEAALYTAPDWAATPLEDRAAIFLRAAELLAGPWRDTLNAATMLGQSKTCYQAEIDAACELIDFWRFNVAYAAEVLGEQPHSPAGTWNRVDHRPLEGFVLAVTPFNFTSIAGNLPTAPALMGNTVLWKPSEKQGYAAHFTMALLREAGLPDGVINLLHGDGALVADVCFDHPDFAGLHFTGSAQVLQDLWRKIGHNIRSFRSFPRVVGESGGKDFVVAHPSADADALVTALVRGAFEYQGQKCSAASRAYLPASTWVRIRDRLVDVTRALRMGDVADFRNFMGAVIDRKAFDKHTAAIEEARQQGDVGILVGGGSDDREGWFVEPTVITTADPRYRTMQEELFGPILTVYVYDDAAWEWVLDVVDTTSPYGLTGAVFATDRGAIADATARLRHAAGNFYVNDKPTGAVVAQQPFGGGRGSGTNDKAGSKLNLLRWVSPRAIKENFLPPTDHPYPHMFQE